MSRVLIVCPDHVKSQMSGPAIRYFELARQLRAAGHEVILSTPAPTDLTGVGFPILQHGVDRLRELAEHQDVIVYQGWMLRIYPFLAKSPAALVCDLYCPMYLEFLVDWNHSSGGAQETDPLDVLGMTLDSVRRADYFICASEKQRDYWLGVLTAANRINPTTYASDESLRQLIDVVPFGLPDEAPEAVPGALRRAFPAIGAQDFVLLWGSMIYNWFDPLTLIRAVDAARAHVPNLRLVIMASRPPNPDILQDTRMQGEARALADELRLTGRHVFFNEGWVPYDERAGWLLDSDVGVSTHFEHIESHFSFRVRFLDYLWAGLPMLCTEGDILAEAVERHELGVTVPPGDVRALAAAIERLADGEARAGYRANVERYAATMTWSRAAQRLLEFCAHPHRAPDVDHDGRRELLRVPIPEFVPLLSDGGARDWRYYVVRGTDTLVHGGPSELARRFTRMVDRRRRG